MKGKELREARQKLGLTQAQIARLMGMPTSSYTRIETGDQGRKPTRQHAATVELLLKMNDCGCLPNTQAVRTERSEVPNQRIVGPQGDEK